MVHALYTLLLWLALVPLALAGIPLMQPSAAELDAPYALSRSTLLEDPEGKLSPSQALQALRKDQRQVSGDAHIGYSRSVWWQAVQLQLPQYRQIKLMVTTPALHTLQVRVYADDYLISYLNSGFGYSLFDSSEPLPYFVMPLPQLTNQPYTVLLRYTSEASMNVPLRLVAAEALPEMVASDWLRYGLLIGALTALGLFYLIRFSSLGERRLAYLGLVALCAALHIACVYSVGRLLYDISPDLSRSLINLSLTGLMLFSSIFLVSALELSHLARRLRWALYATILTVSLGGLLLQHPRTYQVINLLLLSCGVYQLFILTQAIRRRRPYALGYLLCWSALLLMMLIPPLVRAGLIEQVPQVYSAHIYLPVIGILALGALLDKQLEEVRHALVNSQQRAIDILERYQGLFRHSGEGIFRCDEAGALVEINPSFTRLIGYTGHGDAQNLTLPALIGTSTWQALYQQLRDTGRAASISRECSLHDLDGKRHWVYLSLHQQTPFGNIDGIAVDLSERRRLEERLQNLAVRDVLTGLYNRRELENLLSEALSNLQQRRFSHLLCLDLDRFKQVNDLCGHSAGDQLLRQLAGHLRRALPAPAELARIGGDEFAALLQEPDDQTALCKAELLRNAVEDFVFTWQGRTLRLHASLGLVGLNDGVDDWEAALNWASNAAQLAKFHGRNRVQLYSPGDGDLLAHQRQLQWTIRLREAAEHNHFELFYQPVRPATDIPHGLHYEVLLRYRDPQSGEWISPANFLDAAARYGLLSSIDRWVFHNLCRWLASNPKHRSQLAQVNVNLSPESLLDCQFHQFIEEQLHTHQLPAQLFCIEITEMATLGELSVSANWIARLRELGVKVALDDFGSGFASYAYLRHLPLDILKIDGTFIRDIEADPVNQAMVRSMQQIAEQLNLETVAEFVGSAQTLACVRALGVDFVQGNFIGCAQPLEQLSDRHAGR